MCVGVTLWFGCGGVVSVCRLQPAYGYQNCKEQTYGLVRDEKKRIHRKEDRRKIVHIYIIFHPGKQE